MTTERVDVVIRGRDMASGVLGKVTRRFKTMGQSVFNLQTAMKGLAGAFVIRGALRGAGSLITAYNQQEKAIVGMNAALRIGGQLTEENSRLIQDHAAALQRVTTAGDEALIAVSGTVAQLATELSATELAEVQKAVVGLSEAFGLDLQAAAQLVGKSLGSTTNALSRYGVMVDVNASQSEKLAEIMRATGGFFDVAKAKTNTMEGAWRQLGNAVGDLKEELGGILIEILTLGDGTATLTEKVFQTIDAIKENRAVVVAWGRVVLEAAKVFIQAGITIVRVAFNIGQVVGDVFRGLGMLLIGVFTLNLGMVQAAFTETKDAIVKDVGDIVDAFGDWGRAIDDVAAALGTARGGGAAAGAGGGGGLFGGGTLSPITVEGGLGLRRFTPRFEHEAVEVEGAASDMAKTVADNFKSMATTVIADSSRAATAVVSMITNIAATAAGGPLGSVIGLAGGIIGGLFGRRREPAPVRIAEVDERAAKQLERHRGPTNVTVHIVDQFGRDLSGLQYQLNRQTARDAQERLPGGHLG